jgi:hypothetical protein
VTATTFAPTPTGPHDLLADAAGWLSHRPWLVGASLAAIGGRVVGRNVVAGWRHRRLARGARLVTIAPPPEVDTAGAAAAWMNLTGVLTPSTWRRLIHGTPHVALEYTWAGRELTVRLWVPGTIPPGAVEAAVRGAWPGAAATVSDAAPPIPLTAAAATGGAFVPALPDTLPLRLEHDTDPLRPLLSAGAEVRDDEYACVQILARPATAARARRARRAAGQLRTGTGGGPGMRPGNAIARAATAPLTWIVEVFLPGPPRRPTRMAHTAAHRAATAARRDPALERDVRAVLDKTTSTPLYEVAIRYAVATTTVREGSRPQQRLRGLAHTIASAFAAHTGRNTLRRLRMRHPLTVLARRRLGRGFALNLTELGFLAGLPTDQAVPGLDRARAKAVPAPPAVPSGGRGVKRLGHAQVGGRSIGLPVSDARHHLHLVGKTGTGKSTLIVHMVVDDVKAGRGAVVIDPRGDMINDVLDRLPAYVADRVHIIDPAQERSAYFNPLEGDDPHLAVDNLVGIFSRIFQRHWGPRIDDTLRVSCLTLMQHANPTLSSVPPLLNDDAFRAQFTVGLDDPEGLHGYWQWYDSMNPPMRAQVIGPVLARLRAFLLRDFVRGVVGGPSSSFDMGQILDGGLLLVRLPKGVLGEDTTRVLGSLVVARVWQAATARASQPEQSRKDCSLYIDECQNFLNLPGSVADMLAEARGYRLSLVLAHQDLAQLPKDVAAAASANARTKVFFTVDPTDAKTLSAHTLPELDEHDLAHLDRHTAAARVVVNGRELPAFTFATRQPPPVIGEATAIRQACAAATPVVATSPLESLARSMAAKSKARKAERDRRGTDQQAR